MCAASARYLQCLSLIEHPTQILKHGHEVRPFDWRLGIAGTAIPRPPVGVPKCNVSLARSLTHRDPRPRRERPGAIGQHAAIALPPRTRRPSSPPNGVRAMDHNQSRQAGAKLGLAPIARGAKFPPLKVHLRQAHCLHRTRRRDQSIRVRGSHSPSYARCRDENKEGTFSGPQGMTQEADEGRGAHLPGACVPAAGGPLRVMRTP